MASKIIPIIIKNFHYQNLLENLSFNQKMNYIPSRLRNVILALTKMEELSVHALCIHT